MTARILIADRDPLVRDHCCRYLSAYGYGVTVAADGLQCVEQLRDSCPDLLVLDPEIFWGGGQGVLEWLQDVHPAAPMKIVLTDGHAQGVFPPERNRRTAGRLERPTGLADLPAFAVGLQRFLSADAAPIRRSSRRNEPIRRSREEQRQ